MVTPARYERLQIIPKVVNPPRLSVHFRPCSIVVSPEQPIGPQEARHVRLLRDVLPVISYQPTNSQRPKGTGISTKPPSPWPNIAQAGEPTRPTDRPGPVRTHLDFFVSSTSVSLSLPSDNKIRPGRKLTVNNIPVKE